MTESRFSRRTFLGLLGAAGMAAFVAGCDKDNRWCELPDPHGPDTTSIIPDFTQPPNTLPTPQTPPVTPTLPGAHGIYQRASWTKAGPTKNVVAMNGVKRITFHHSGNPRPFTTTDLNETAQMLESIRLYHRSQNYQDIGYHYAIDRAGRVWQLRSPSLQGQHTRYNNENNLGVVLLGNYDQQTLTSAQQAKIKSFAAWLRTQYPTARFHTHQELVKTGCPGKHLQAYLLTLRKQRQI